MPWFTSDATAFFAELEQNNTKEWFEPNKPRYEALVKRPMLEFAAEMIERMRALDPAITMLPRNAVFRIHRDTRFSPNKTPYKTNASMAITRAERHAAGVSGLYFHFDASRMAVASGLYFLEPPQLKLVRRTSRTTSMSSTSSCMTRNGSTALARWLGKGTRFCLRSSGMPLRSSRCCTTSSSTTGVSIRRSR